MRGGLDDAQKGKRDRLIGQLQMQNPQGKVVVEPNPADELMWLNFETRMRQVIRRLVEPVVDMSQKDREGMIILESNYNTQIERINNLEEAVFNISAHGEETLFEKMAKKIKKNEIYMKKKIKEIRDEQEHKYNDIDSQLFLMRQDVHKCLVLKKELDNLEREQRGLQIQVMRFNNNTIDESKRVREMIQMLTQNLQKQISSHTDSLENLKPRMRGCEDTLARHKTRMDGFQ